MSDSSDIEHFSAITDILRRSKPAGSSIFYHEYHHQAFGSFTLVAGRPHQILRFDWDGKESELKVSQGETLQKTGSSSWKTVCSVKPISGSRLYAQILENLLELFRSDIEHIREVLRKWDPIGVHPGADKDSAPADEYDPYASGILALLRAGAPVNKIEERLAEIRISDMELPACPEIDKQISESLLLWWENKKAKQCLRKKSIFWL
jgi:hypothetical protein